MFWCVVLCHLMVRIYKCYATEFYRVALEFLSSCPQVSAQSVPSVETDRNSADPDETAPEGVLVLKHQSDQGLY